MHVLNIVKKSRIVSIYEEENVEISIVFVNVGIAFLDCNKYRRTVLVENVYFLNSTVKITVTVTRFLS